MNRILRITVFSEFLAKSKVVLSRSVGNFSKVKVEFDNNDMQIYFRYLNKNHKISNAKAQEEVGNILSRIKGIAISRQENCVDDHKEDTEVYLMHGDEFVKSNMPNIDAWIPGSLLKIGSFLYEVKQKEPIVKCLTLPQTIMAGGAIRPHFELDHSDANQSSFVWYHSVSEEEAKLCNTEADCLVKVNEQWWVKVYEGMIYWTSENDVGRRLRVVCTPKLCENEGEMRVAESQNAVCSGPEYFPFQERHLYTQQVTDSNSVRCLTYNILAAMYAEQRKFPYCSEVAINKYYRRQLLMKELLGYNGDILCLQEVQMGVFKFDLSPVLQNAGFDGYHTRKSGPRSEGLACFFRRSKFRVVSQEDIHLNKAINKDKDIFYDLLSKVAGNSLDLESFANQYSVLQILLLEHLDNPKRRILVANTHLYSNKDKPGVRLLQSAVCAGYIEHQLKSQDAGDSTAVLFCGDFNSMPDSAVLEFLLKGSYECCPSWRRRRKNSSESQVDTTIRHNLTIDSACGFPMYTNYTKEFKGCLDYIFYSTDLFSVDEIVPLPSEESLAQDVALPSEVFPSDHIPLICTLKWK